MIVSEKSDLKEKRLSIIVIGYNIEKYVKKCIESIAFQLSDSDELIFVNDGSVDNTLIRVAECRHKWNNIHIVDQENKGIIGARKAGLQTAAGEYVLFVDGDDYINKDMVSNYMDLAMKLGHTYDIIMSDHWEERPNGQILRRTSDHPYGEMKGDMYLRGILDGSLNHFLVNKLYKRAFLLRANYLKYPNITFAEDQLANSFFGIYEPKVFYADMTNYYYQYNDTSVSRKEDFGIVDRQIHALRLISKVIRKKYNDRYEDYLNYQWYQFAGGYLQTGYSHRFKKYLMRRCASNVKKGMKTRLMREQPLNLSTMYGRVMVFFYLRIPCMAGLINMAVRALIAILHRFHLLKKY